MFLFSCNFIIILQFLIFTDLSRDFRQNVYLSNSSKHYLGLFSKINAIIFYNQKSLAFERFWKTFSKPLALPYRSSHTRIGNPKFFVL